MELTFDDRAAGLMRDKGYREEDIAEVIAYAESAAKLVQPDSGECLGRKRLGQVTVNVRYRCLEGPDRFLVTGIYQHRALLDEDGEG